MTTRAPSQSARVRSGRALQIAMLWPLPHEFHCRSAGARDYYVRYRTDSPAFVMCQSRYPLTYSYASPSEVLADIVRCGTLGA